MTITCKLTHQLLYGACKITEQRYRRGLNDVQASQRQSLARVLGNTTNTDIGQRYHLHKNLSAENYQRHVPISNYEDWAVLIERQKTSEKAVLCNDSVSRYQPTSGSTSHIKWIPYSKQFLSELDTALAPWMHDMYQRYPGIKNGKHYWSISWLPTELRTRANSNINNDLNLVPFWKRIILSQSMAMPASVAEAETSEESLFITLCYLAANQQLSLISVWSPTFFLNLLSGLAKYKDAVEQTLASGQWALFGDSLAFISAPKSIRGARLLREWHGHLGSQFFQSLWPNLTLISAWDTSTSSIWADKLKSILNFCAFQGKGLWATEGAVTIPFEGKYPLCSASHYFEFMDVGSQKIYFPWQLEDQQVVSPVLSTGNGLLRYAMKDQLRVDGFVGDTPSLTFLGRMDSVDLVGEKLSTDVAFNILSRFDALTDYEPISLLAVPNRGQDPGKQPFYVLLIKGSENQALQKTVNIELERTLQKHFHYKLARELHQLAPARCVISKDALSIYQSRGIRRGMVVGNIKVEPLQLWDDVIPEAFVYSPCEVSQVKFRTGEHRYLAHE